MTKYKYYLASFSLIIFIFITNWLTKGIDISQLNVYDAFLELVVEDGAYTAIAIIIAAIIPTFDLSKNNKRKTFDSSQPLFDSFFALHIKESLGVGIVFLAANIFALVICFVLASKSALYTGLNYGQFGTFAYTRINTPLVYIILYMINCSLFGLLLNVFSRCVSDLTNRKHLVLIVSILYYYSHVFLPFVLIQSDLFNILSCLFPGLFYGFLQYDVNFVQRLLGFAFMILVSFLLFYISCFKMKLIGNNLKKESAKR